MATPVMLPRQGQSVETCLIIEWKKKVGDKVAAGEVLCEVETDKAAFEIEAPAAGVLLGIFFPEGEDVPVLTNIAAIGEEGENVDALNTGVPTETETPPQVGADGPAALPTQAPPNVGAADGPQALCEPIGESEASTMPRFPAAPATAGAGAVSPRARGLAAESGVNLAAIAGTGPGGRIIERDVRQAVAAGPMLTPTARAAVGAGGAVPQAGTGIGGRVRAADLAAAPAAGTEDKITEVKVKGIRKLIAERMHSSLQTTAQLSMNTSADATAMLNLRKKLKASPEEMGLSKITINDLLLVAVARTLPAFPELNALFQNNTVYRYATVHLAFAVDTARGLMVPVIRHANLLTLMQIASAAKALAKACIEGGINPDDLQGGTITVSNLGALGIESFTPILNAPQVAVLGVGKIGLKPVQTDGGEVDFVPHIGLSLTINHMVVDGGPAARFLAALGDALANIEVYLAL